MLMNSPDAIFSLFEEQDKHLYYMFKNNIRGGPSIILNRYQEVDKTLIRENKLCKNIKHYWFRGLCSLFMGYITLTLCIFPYLIF